MHSIPFSPESPFQLVPIYVNGKIYSIQLITTKTGLPVYSFFPTCSSFLQATLGSEKKSTPSASVIHFITASNDANTRVAFLLKLHQLRALFWKLQLHSRLVLLPDLMCPASSFRQTTDWLVAGVDKTPSALAYPYRYRVS